MRFILPAFIFFAQVAGASEVNPQIASNDSLPPNACVYDAVKDALNKYGNRQYYKSEFKIEKVDQNGYIATNWHPVHKSEISFLVEVYVWGMTYHLDVWQRPSWGMFKQATKNLPSRLAEMRLQKEIDDAVQNKCKGAP